ncbi:MAG: hypothetical protein SGJ27_06900 [Candidatus Melainabacteria bacterium]|nr:hypothetical protein [Candidatus Melainabacteria bacterium]
MMAVSAISSLVKTVIIFYEIAFLILLIAVVVFLGRPLVEAYSDRIRSRTKTIVKETSPVSILEAKVDRLESEVMELKLQLKSVQESTDFVLNLAQAEPQPRLKVADEQHVE